MQWPEPAAHPKPQVANMERGSCFLSSSRRRGRLWVDFVSRVSSRFGPSCKPSSETPSGVGPGSPERSAQGSRKRVAAFCFTMSP